MQHFITILICQIAPTQPGGVFLGDFPFSKTNDDQQVSPSKHSHTIIFPPPCLTEGTKHILLIQNDTFCQRHRDKEKKITADPHTHLSCSNFPCDFFLLIGLLQCWFLCNTLTMKAWFMHLTFDFEMYLLFWTPGSIDVGSKLRCSYMLIKILSAFLCKISVIL